MKFQRTTLILLMVAVGLGAGVYLWETQAPSRPPTAENSEEQPLFRFSESDVQRLEVRQGEETLVFERLAEAAIVSPSPSPASPSPASPPPNSYETTEWRMVSPKTGLADDAAVDFLVNLLATGSRDRTLRIEPADLDEFGLTTPSATVEIQLKNQETHRLVLGTQNFNGEFLYAQIDPPETAEAEVEVVLIPKNFESAVNRDLAEWQASPDAPAPAPSPSPSPEAAETTSPSPSSPPDPAPPATP